MTLDHISSIYLEVTGQWKGCDWPVTVGSIRLGDGRVTASQAEIAAKATSGREADNWRRLAAWLAQVERDAEQAECRARLALELAEAGRLADALVQADSACGLEARYPRPSTWQVFRQAIADALADSGNPGLPTRPAARFPA